MSKIAKPGVYDGISNADYHKQLTPTPSISAGMAVDLMDTCPRKLWNGCYLNPDLQREEKTAFDLGTAAHLALLEPGEWNARTVIIDAADYKKPSNQDLRDDAYLAGKTPLLPKHVDQIMGLRKAVLADPIAGPAFEGGHSEQTVVCRDRKTGVYLKCRPDKRANDWSWIADIKTTTTANPRALRAKAFEDGWGQRAEWYMDVVEEAAGVRPTEFFFIVAEIKAPHLITVCRFKPQLGDKPAALGWASMMNRKAIDVFAECVAANKWPSYTDRVVDLEFPNWAEYRLQERCDAGDFAPRYSAAIAARAAEFHQPLGAG